MLKTGDSAGLARHLPDADRAEILAELETLPPKGKPAAGPVPEPPLKGIRVLDLCQVVAGPTCGRLLAEYGAEVIKINNPRIMDNFTALGGHETQFNGKKTIFLDLKSAEGKAVMEELIREADVFHCNFAQEAYIHLNYTEEELRERNPGIILSQVNIHSLGGGREWFRGHEDLGEAITGMSMRYGGTLKPDTLPLLVLDHMTGQMSAFGVLLAIYARMLDGEGQRVQACLSRSSTLAQLPFMLGYAGKVWDEPAGPECWGYGVFDRIYHAKDRPFYLAASPEQLKAVPELRGVAWETAASLPYQLERLFGQETCEHWVSLLRSRGVAAAPCRVYQAEFAGDEYAYASGIARMENHPGLGMLRTVHCPPRMSLTPPQPCYPGSAPGTDTEAFLREFHAAHPGAGK
jgi:crotonobetainyl-CoA:carnitine CoA-transferase CaiB-like acyl-CoA transferase